MKKIPRVVIIGRPNVGKSTLINKITRQKKAITDDQPGVTRDLKEFLVIWNKKPFYLVDTGGIFFESAEDIYLQPQIENLVQNACEKAEKIIFITDLLQGIHPQDKHIANVIRKYQDKTIVAANKADNPNRDLEVSQFFELGLNDPIPISAIHGNGIPELLELVTDTFQPSQKVKELIDNAYRVSIVGRPNVGKSSLLNTLVNEERVIVDNKAGTTRDAIEVFFNEQHNRYVFIDTAGMRRRTKVKDNIEFYSVVRASKSIKESDLVIVVLDATQFLVDQDKKIIQQVIQAKKNMIIFVNKWDLTSRQDSTRKELLNKAQRLLPYLEYYPFIFGSALEKLNFGKLFNEIPKVIEKSEIRIKTGELNRFVDTVIKQNPPPAKYGRHVKIYYATQPETNPPCFIFFVNHPQLVQEEYIRFIKKHIRSFFGGFTGNPIQVFVKGKHKAQS